MNFVSFKKLHEDIKDFCSKIPDVDLIIGIPRSGLFIANLIALQKNVPFGVIYPTGGFILFKGGFRDTQQGHNKALVIDDSYASGTSMQLAKEYMKYHKAIYGCLYIEPGKEKEVDVYQRIVPQPRMFEWNFMQHGDLEQSCVDIDGVLCRDILPQESEIDFFKTVVPYCFPKYKIHSLVTGREEKYREVTEWWLKKYNIQYTNLLMRADKTEPCEDFKTRIYKNSNCKLFIESTKHQALIIAKETKRPVLCTETMKIYAGTQ